MSEIVDEPWIIRDDAPAPDSAEFVVSDFVQIPVEPYISLSEGMLSHSGGREIDEDMTEVRRAFAEHVAYVRDNGDMLEPSRRYYDSRQIVGRNAARGAVIGEFGALAMGGAYSTAIVAGIAVGGMYVADVRARNKIASQVEDDASVAAVAQEAVGEQYELFRIKNKQSGQHEIVMRWYGTPDSPESEDEGSESAESARKGDDSLKLMAELAKSEGISAVLVSNYMLDHSHFNPEQYASDKLSLPGWIGKHKKLDPRFTNLVKSMKDPEVYAFTPDQLAAMADAPKMRQEQVASIGGIVAILRSHDPRHRIVRAYDEHSGNPDVVLGAISQAAKQAIEPKIHDIGSRFNREANGAPVRERIMLQGRLDGDMASMQGSGKYNGQEFERTGLLRALNLTEVQVTQILQDHHNYADRKVVLAAECAAYLQAQQPLNQEVVDKPDRYMPMEHNTGDLINESLMNNGRGVNRLKHVPGFEIDTRVNTRMRRLIASTMVALAAGTTLTLSDIADHYDARPVSDVLEIAKDSLHAMDDGLGAIGSRIAGIWNTDKPGLDTTDGMSGSSQDIVGIGNVGDSEEALAEVDWDINKHGGMSTEGYWAAATGDRFNVDGFTWLTRLELDTDSESEASTFPSDIREAIDNPDDGAYLTVRRAVTGTEGSNSMYGNQSYTYLSIPVLEGTAPIAANVNGEAVNVSLASNGTYALVFPSYQGERNVTYWLGPDANAQTATNVTDEDADTQTAFIDYSATYTGHYTSDEQRAVRQAWETELGREYTDDQERLQAQVDYIHDTFDYSRTPLDPEFQERVAAGEVRVPEFVNEVLADGEVVCNTAAMVVAVDNPEVATVTGYRNDEDSELTVGEYHMWLTDREGTYYDPTPGGGPEAGAGAIGFTTPGTLAIAGMALVGAAYGANRLRPRVSGKVAAMQSSRSTERAQDELQTISTEELFFAKQITDRNDFAPHLGLRNLPQLPEHMTRDQVLELVTAPHMHDANIRNSLAQAIAKTPAAEDKQALKRAAAILTTIRKAGLAKEYHKPVEAQSTDLSGVL